MQEYDVVFKVLLQKSLWRVAGKTVVRWLPTELPSVQNLRVDLLGETDEGELIQLEIQSRHHQNMPFRMLEYMVLITRHHGRVPRQLVLYVGPERMRMQDRFEWSDGVARFKLLDIRDLDSSALLESTEPSDNVLGILTRLQDSRAAVRSIVARLAGLPPDENEFYLNSLLILAGLRNLEATVEEEIARMPFEIDILENKVIGPAYRRGVEQGREEGLEEGLHAGQIRLLERQVRERFGDFPILLREHIAQFSADQLDELSVRVLNARSIDDLFG